MAHVRESFPVLEGASQEGLALRAVQVGDSTASKNGLLGFSFKDSSGNAVLPTLTTEGKVPVDLAGAGVPKQASASAEVAGSLTEVTVAEVSLTTSKTYGSVMANCSCFKEAIFYLYQLDDVTETLISAAIVGPGQYSFHIDLGKAEYVAGGSGTQKFILKAKNLQKESDFLGDVSCLELAV